MWVDKFSKLCYFKANGFASRLKYTPPEGIVMRPAVELLNRRLGRVISKLKLNDFGEVDKE